MFNLVSSIKMTNNGKSIFLIVNDIKQFKNDVIEQFGARKNKRWDFEKQVAYKVNDFVRDQLGTKKKHITWTLVTIDKNGNFRNEKGHFVKM